MEPSAATRHRDHLAGERRGQGAAHLEAGTGRRRQRAPHRGRRDRVRGGVDDVDHQPGQPARLDLQGAAVPVQQGPGGARTGHLDHRHPLGDGDLHPVGPVPADPGGGDEGQGLHPAGHHAGVHADQGRVVLEAGGIHDGPLRRVGVRPGDGDGLGTEPRGVGQAHDHQDQDRDHQRAADPAEPPPTLDPPDVHPTLVDAGIDVRGLTAVGSAGRAHAGSSGTSGKPTSRTSVRREMPRGLGHQGADPLASPPGRRRPSPRGRPG